MDPDRVAEGHSPLHSLDVRTRLLGVLAFSVVVAFLRSPAALGLALVLSLAFVLAARTPAGFLLRRLATFNLFLAFLWLFIPWSFPGEEAFGIGGLVATREGIGYMTAMTLRANALVIALVALMSTTSITAMTHAMSALRAPDKITYLFFLTYRYVGEISGEYERLVNAMKVRCFRPSTSLHTYRSYAYLVGMLLVNSFERACRVQAAMLCRGFDGRFHRLDGEAVTWRDAACLVALCLALAGIVYADG